MFNKKVLCLGSNNESTDQLVTDLAISNSTKNHGLIESDTFVPENPGFYHTTVVDINPGGIVRLASVFDCVVLLDQELSLWDHWKTLLTTFRTMQKMEEQGICVEYRDNKNIKKYLEFDQLLKNNKSFCIYPWIEKIEHSGNLMLCARSAKVVKPLAKLEDWDTDPDYTEIRNKMLSGERIPEYCRSCYGNEDRGVESYREFETKEWVGKLNINSVDDLKKIKHPHYYEVRLSNKCNIACRGCRPEHSSKIETEFKKFDIVFPDQDLWWQYSSLNVIDTDTLGPDVRVYLTGGEPTVMRDVYKFMEKCVELKKTDFDFTIGTNAVALSKKFIDLSSHFTNMGFSVSLDGYGKVNDYWRWGSNWDTVIDNIKILESQGHSISINCVPGIYNVTNLHLLFEFLDSNFPHANLYLQLNYFDMHSAFNHPNKALVVESMKKCQNTKIYYADGKSVKSVIDSLYNHYTRDDVECNIGDLQKFFDYNDRLDEVRNSRLGDYIPELEECRKYLYNKL